MYQIKTPLQLLQGREDILKLTDTLTRLFVIFRELNIKDSAGNGYNYEIYQSGYKFYNDFLYGTFDRVMLMGKDDLMLEIGKTIPEDASNRERNTFNMDQAILRWRLQEGF